MAIFDLKAFADAAKGGAGTLGAVGGAFGLPSCLFNFIGEAGLALLPTPVLLAIRETTLAAQALADDVVKGIFSKLTSWLGIIEWDTEEGGFRFISNTSKSGLARFNGGVLGAVGGVLGAFDAALAFGGRLYANYENGRAQIESLIDCLRSFRKYLRGVTGDTLPQDPVAFENYINEKFAAEKFQLEYAENFINRCDQLVAQIDGVLNCRATGECPEPQFTCDYADILSGTVLNVSCPPTQQIPSEIFRLVYGPPKSKVGQFILSQDGLYFDSQVSGLKPALLELTNRYKNIPFGDRWKFEQDANLGGRGKGFSTKDLEDHVNTILDPNKINESLQLKVYYDQDNFLQELIGNRDKRVYDLSSHITELEIGNAPKSVIYNLKQSLISENTSFQEKINKRKKQIELAVELPRTFSSPIRYTPGEVPVNDFSYLADVNLSLEIKKQKAMSFSQQDVSGVISPIQTSTYVVSPAHNRNSSTEHLLLSPLSEGAIIFDGSGVSATNATILQAESFLESDSLIAMYNFLQTTVQDPSSTEYLLRNSGSDVKDSEYFAQLVAPNPDQAFPRGLAIPYLHGITKHSSINSTAPSALGSYIRLRGSPKIDDLLYSDTGATIDFWVHVPNLNSVINGYNDGNASGLYRLVLASENVGGTSNSTDTEHISNKFDNSVVRGFIMGFTRDRRISKQLPASNLSEDNTVDDSVFFIAPTQSLNASSAGFINRSYFDNNNCIVGTSYHSMTYPINNTNQQIAFSSCEYKFSHVAVTFDPVKDEVSFYLDGSKLVTSSMSNVFGIKPYTMPYLPTLANQTNSFQYNTTSVGPYASNDLKSGPKIDNYFTPWIVGGGYTDGMYGKGNFMGGTYGGIISGLKGYLGSLKFYSKPLTPIQVLNNYNSQKNFFENIDTLTLGWEPIILA